MITLQLCRQALSGICNACSRATGAKPFNIDANKYDFDLSFMVLTASIVLVKNSLGAKQTSSVNIEKLSPFDIYFDLCYKINRSSLYKSIEKTYSTFKKTIFLYNFFLIHLSGKKLYFVICIIYMMQKSLSWKKLRKATFKF